MTPKQNMTQYTVVLKNEPGELQRLAQALAKEQVNILGLAVEAHADIAHVRFIVEKNQNVRRAFEGIDLRAYEAPVYRVALQNRPGELARLAKALAEHDVNIETLYGTTDGEDAARLVLKLDKPEKAEKVLSSFAEGLEMASR